MAQPDPGFYSMDDRSFTGMVAVGGRVCDRPWKLLSCGSHFAAANPESHSIVSKTVPGYVIRREECKHRFDVNQDYQEDHACDHIVCNT